MTLRLISATSYEEILEAHRARHREEQRRQDEARRFFEAESERREGRRAVIGAALLTLGVAVLTAITVAIAHWVQP